jgi:predicted enzyme related to lactoylglutathione lyase
MPSIKDAPFSAVLRAEDYYRARQFYADKLGLEVEDAPGGHEGFVHGGQGTRVLIYERPGMPAPQNTTLSIAVDDVEQAVSELRGRGVVFEEYQSPEMGLSTESGIATMEHERAAWFKDSEGNYVVLSQWLD